MASHLVLHRTFLRRCRPHHSRTFSTAHPRLAPSFLDLQARSVSRENGHFAKLSGVNYIEHSPSLQLLRSERDLAEGKTAVQDEATGILLTKCTRGDRDALVLEDHKKQIATLQSQLLAKERTWRERYTQERREWEDAEERSLRLRLMFGVSLVVLGLLAADSVALADDVEEHCPGCFAGNTKKDLFVVGYLKSATEGLARWWNGGEVVKKSAGVKHEGQKRVKEMAAVPVTAKEKMHDKDMPSGWEEMQAPDGRLYYANHIERYTTWLDPRKGPAPGQVDVSTAPMTIDDGLSFWQRLMWASR